MKKLEPKNNNNKLGLKERSYLKYLTLEEGITIAIPTLKGLADLMILDIYDDGAFTAHWIENYNTDGDFRSELMRFDNDLILDKMDLKKRNQIRIKNGLYPIE